MSKKDSPKGRSGARSLAELQALSQMKRSPAALRLGEAEAVQLPAVAAPSLEGLSVAPAGPTARVTEQDLITRFQTLRRQHSDFRERAPDEAVALEDDVLLDVVGFHDDRVMPFSPRADWWARVAPDPLLPGFFESLVDVPVGNTVRIELVLPDTYAVPALRGQTVCFVMEVKSAKELIALDDDSPELLARMGLGASLPDVMRALAGDLALEREAEAERQRQEEVMDQLVARTPVDLPTAAVDEELRLFWVERDRPLLMLKGFSPEGLQAALQALLDDPIARADVVYRLTLDLALRAIAERDGIQPDRATADAYVEDLLRTSGMSRQDLKQAAAQDPALDRRLYDQARRLATIAHVMKHVTLTPPEA
jgi:trigger factor